MHYSYCLMFEKFDPFCLGIHSPLQALLRNSSMGITSSYVIPFVELEAYKSYAYVGMR